MRATDHLQRRYYRVVPARDAVRGQLTDSERFWVWLTLSAIMILIEAAVI
jgi:hypothetical protein